MLNKLALSIEQKERNMYMKKRVLATILCMTTLFGIVGCKAEKRSGQMDIDPQKQVKELCEYKGIELSLTGQYEVTDDMVQEAYVYLVQNSGLDMVEITDRTMIQDGDYVKVDYTGYHKGTAFEGGAAKGAFLQLSADNGYIPGFTDGLVGAEVGSTVSHDVTFPDPYMNNEELSGELTTFEFVIHGIYKKVDVDQITDEQVAANYSDTFGVSTKEELKNYVRDSLVATAESNKYSDTVTAVGDYMLANSDVDIPEEYLEARVREFRDSFEETYCAEGESLEDYLKENYKVTLEGAMEEWTVYLEEQIAFELIFGLVAEKEGLEIDEEEFKQYIDGFKLPENGGFEDEESIYKYYGAGNEKEGEEYLRRLFLVNEAITFVAENAVTTETTDGAEK